jgi:cell division protein ZapA (FtsZ GTPase activity inhibitor)
MENKGEIIPRNIKINGKAYPLDIPRADEEYYERAAQYVTECFKKVSSSYIGASLSREEVALFVALEAMMDALKVNHNYQKLQVEVQKQLDEISRHLPD